ncbi:RND family transporter [Chlamydiota bacterium]
MILNNIIQRYIYLIIKHKYSIIVLSLFFIIFSSIGLKNLSFSTNYHVYFGEDNPQYIALQNFEKTYVKDHHVFIVLAPKDGTVFTKENLFAIQQITKDAWEIPYCIRVDSLTNFQHIKSQSDDLIVKNLVEELNGLNNKKIEDIKNIALTEPLLVNRLISKKGDVTGVFVSLQLPGEDSSFEVNNVMNNVKQLVKKINKNYSNFNVYITGIAPFTDAINKATIHDLTWLSPVIYIFILFCLFFFLKSISATFSSLILILVSTLTGVGLGSWLEIQLSAPSSIAPVIIMTLAVAYSVLILILCNKYSTDYDNKRDILVKSYQIASKPIFFTALTTVIGFLSLNFSEVPPFRDLGNITAIGIAAAFLYTFAFFPVLITFLPFKKKNKRKELFQFVQKIPLFVINNRKYIIVVFISLFVILSYFIKNIELNDKFIEYLDKKVPFRKDTEFVSQNLTGLYQIEYSIGEGDDGLITEPEYLEKLDEFAEWFRRQKDVAHVYVFTDIMKKINKALHNDDPLFYRVPETRELAAQYLLLYEMSLPFGLNLNNYINVKKSATRLTVTTAAEITSNEFRELTKKGEEWLQENAPEYMHASATGSSVVFIYLSNRNIHAMLKGVALAFLKISIVLIIAFRSFKWGVLSLIPNIIPALMTFGLWGLLVGRIGMAISVAASVTIGVVVDNTIHILSTYLTARRELNKSPEEALFYAYGTIGNALWITTFILIVGFLVLAGSSFEVNWSLGLLSIIIFIIALLADFFFLPSLILTFDKKK